jgi:hypothetical protein
MTSPEPADVEFDRRRIRIGLAFLTLVVLGSLVALIVIQSAVGKMVMLGIFLFTVIRAYLLTRSLRRDIAGAGPSS